jgi:hypothetical protein
MNVRAQEYPAAFCGIAVMAKASYPGQAKTRLCPPLTFEEAAAFNTAFLKDIADNLIAVSADASIAASMAFGPPGSERPSFVQTCRPQSVCMRPGIQIWALALSRRSAGCSRQVTGWPVF